jgi:hypothetical protein
VHAIYRLDAEMVVRLPRPGRRAFADPASTMSASVADYPHTDAMS